MTATIDDQRPAAADTISAAVGEHEAHVLVQRLHATMDRLQQLDPTRLGDAELVDILHEYERFVRRTPTPRHTLVHESVPAASRQARRPVADRLGAPGAALLRGRGHRLGPRRRRTRTAPLAQQRAGAAAGAAGDRGRRRERVKFAV